MCHFWCDEPWGLVKGIARGQVVYLGVTHCYNFVWFHSWWHLMVCVWMLAAAYPRLVLFLSLFLVVPLLAALSPQIETVPIFQTQPMSSSFPKVFLGQIRSTSATFFFFFYFTPLISMQFILQPGHNVRLFLHCLICFLLGFPTG